MVCPNCNSCNIINIDMREKHLLFECGSCKTRFHTSGIAPTEIEASHSLSIGGQNDLNFLLKRK